MIVDEKDFSLLHPRVLEVLRGCERELCIKLQALFADALAQVPVSVQADVKPTFDVLELGLPGVIFRADLDFFKMVSGLVEMNESLQGKSRTVH